MVVTPYLKQIFILQAFASLSLAYRESPEEIIAMKYHWIAQIRSDDWSQNRAMRLPIRKQLPPGVFSPDEVATIPCGSYLSLLRGHHYFKMKSKAECLHAFVGSHTENCTAAILCDQKVSMNPSDCKVGYMILYDGTIGFQKGCGEFSFGGVPYYARNGGRDIYVVFKGEASAQCVAFCKEELNNAHYVSGRIKEPRRIKGLQIPPAQKIDASCTCGVRRQQTGRTMNKGERSEIEFPGIGAVVWNYNGLERTPFCDASLISDKYAISSAHCFHDPYRETLPKEVKLLFHANRLALYKGPDLQRDGEVSDGTITDESEGTIRVGVEKIIRHPLYAGIAENFDYDVAILKFERSLIEEIKSGKVSPLCLPKVQSQLPFSSEQLHTLTGWGYNDQSSFSAENRDGFLHKIGDFPLGKCTEKRAAKTHICASNSEGNRKGCRADSGAPVIYELKPEARQYTLSGVVSAGTGCGEMGQPWYTNIQEVVQWIYYQIGDGTAALCKT